MGQGSLGAMEPVSWGAGKPGIRGTGEPGSQETKEPGSWGHTENPGSSGKGGLGNRLLAEDLLC